MSQQANPAFHLVGPLGQKGSSTTPTLSRGLKILSSILGAESPPTLTELATHTVLAKATVSRLLATLGDTGYAAQQPDGQVYLPGPMIARWLRASPLESLLAEKAAPMLDAIRGLTGEATVLCVPAWPDRICISRSLATSPVRAQKDVGDSAPLTRGCTGSAFLAFAPITFVNAALQARPLVQSTPSSVVSPKKLFDLLRTDRKNGYAISLEKTYPHMNGIALPITRRIHRCP